jgi:type III secretory pathway component EscS
MFVRNYLWDLFDQIKIWLLNYLSSHVGFINSLSQSYTQIQTNNLREF